MLKCLFLLLARREHAYRGHARCVLTFHSRTRKKSKSKKPLFKLSITEKLSLQYWNIRLTGQKQSETHTHTHTRKNWPLYVADPVL